MTRLILHITTHDVTAYELDGREIHEVGTFQADENGLESFAAFLNALERVPVYILTDLIEEEFRVESLPHVLGRDRNALHRRHASRLFRTTEFRHSRVLDRQREHRRDDNVLFSALANPDLIGQWLTCLLARNMPVAGIHSVALLSEQLMRPLGLVKSKFLLVTHNKHGGLRQTFLEKGKVRFSRLTPAHVENPEDYSRCIGDEISKTKRYLGSLQFLAPEEKLDVCILSGGAYLAALECCLGERLSDHYRLREVASLAAKTGCELANNEPFCDRLFVSLLARGRCRNIYAAPQHRRHFQTYRLRKGLHVTSLAMACGALLWTGINISDGLILQEQGLQSARLAQQAQARYDAVASRLPAIPVDAEDIAAAVHLAGFIHDWRSQPGPLLLNISHGLDKYANLRLNEIAWRSDMAGDSGQGAPRVEGDMENGTPSQGAEEGVQDGFQYAIIKGEIAPFDGNYLRAHHEIESFARVLRQQPLVSEVKVISLPLNVSQAATVEGHFGGQQSEDAKFSVSIKMRRAHEKVL
ncbi:MAG TPA: hypothetical protein ENJ22_05200 [Gammaproteobacteria bacterium]|nr:hypothetical protein [Gammaproteobacteria bacterium]